MTVKNVRNHTLKGQAGYTLDQTILIVAIIAILITLIVATVGWDLINRSSGTKLAAHMNQVEKAIGLFYGRVGQWPHDALNDDSGAATAGDLTNVLALADSGQFSDAEYTSRHVNLLSGFEISGGAVQHQFGSGGDIGATVTAANIAGAAIDGTYFVIGFDDVPLSEAQEADESIDNTAGVAAGRVRMVAAGAACTAGAVTGSPSTVKVCYIGNLVN